MTYSAEGIQLSYAWAFCIVVFALLILFGIIGHAKKTLENHKKKLEGKIQLIEKYCNDRIQQIKDGCEKKIHENEKLVENELLKISQREEDINKIIDEKTKGFPWLATAIAEYEFLRHEQTENYLAHKSHPARKAAEQVREIGIQRRRVETKLRIAKGLLEYYYKVFPFLEDFYGVEDDDIITRLLSRKIDQPLYDITDSEIDPVDFYLKSIPREEYQKLTAVEKNQLALDRYWKGRKSNWQLGRDYERYIGYIYEMKDFHVTYQGILEGFDDLGRDLICKRKNRTLIIQCKRWAQHKTIHEKHINQLYGTVVKYMLEHPNENIDAIIYTTTNLSDRAKEFAKYLHIIVHESVPFEFYPCIKCNVSRKENERIYHLPFDQMYDKTIIEPERGEFYAATVEEAERKGFRRAWKWMGETI